MFINKIKKSIREKYVKNKYNKYKKVNIDKIELSNFSDIQIDFDSNVEIKKMCLNDFCSIRCRGTSKLYIGDSVHFNNGCILTCRKAITIGDNCSIGPNVMIFDHDHDYKNVHIESNYVCDDIIIGKNVWIGANAIILKGSIIGDNCVIGAGTIIKGIVDKDTLVYNKSNIITKKLKKQ